MYAEPSILLTKYHRHFDVAAEIGQWTECLYAIRQMQVNLDALELHTCRKLREFANDAATPKA